MKIQFGATAIDGGKILYMNIHKDITLVTGHLKIVFENNIELVLKSGNEREQQVLQNMFDLWLRE